MRAQPEASAGVPAEEITAPLSGGGYLHHTDLTLCRTDTGHFILRRNFIMAFFTSAVGTLQTLVVALGAGLGIWGAINLLEGYGNDNRATRS